MWIEGMLEFIKEYGAGTLWLWFFFYFTYLFGKIIVEYVKENILKKKDKIVLPENHSFFTDANYFVKNKLPLLTLHSHWWACQWRTQIFKDMLNIKLTKWSKSLKIALNTKWDIEEIFIDCLVALIEDYNAEWKSLWIPSIVIDKFNEWHSNHVDIYIGAIKSISKWHSFDSTTEKQNAIMEISSAMMILTILDAEKTLWKINWDLSGIEYKWVILK